VPKPHLDTLGSYSAPPDSLAITRERKGRGKVRNREGKGERRKDEKRGGKGKNGREEKGRGEEAVSGILSPTTWQRYF